MGMTNAEAKEHLKDILADVPNDKCIDWIEALNQAIKALEQQEPSDKNIIDPCDGCRYELNSTNGNPCYSCGKYKLTEQQPCEDCIRFHKLALQEWLSSFNTESATACYTAVQRLKESVNDRLDASYKG